MYSYRNEAQPREGGGGGDIVVLPPPNPGASGENGKPVKIENPAQDIKKMIDEGYQKTGFNQYVSDIVSVERSLPDVRDEW